MKSLLSNFNIIFLMIYLQINPYNIKAQNQIYNEPVYKPGVKSFFEITSLEGKIIKNEKAYDFLTPADKNVIKNTCCPIERYSYKINFNLLFEEFIHGQYFDLRCKNNLCYTASTYGLVIFDVFNPSNLTIISTCPTPGCAWGIDIDNEYAYIADYYAGLSIINISDPINPVFVSVTNIGSEAWDVKVIDSIAYVSTSVGTAIINVKDKQNPFIVSGPLGFGGWSCSFSDNSIYTVNLGLAKYKLLTPTNLEFQWYLENGLSTTWNKGIAANDSFVYVGSRDLGVSVIKNINPPIFVTNCNTGGLARGIFMENNKLFVANFKANNYSNTNGLAIIDATNGSSLNLISQINENLTNENVVVFNGKAYVTGWDGVSVINIDNLLTPYTMGSVVNDGRRCLNVTVENNIMCLDMEARINLYDVINPNQPILMSTINQFSVGSIIHSNTLYAGINSNVLKIIDISNPSNPNVLNTFIIDFFQYGLIQSLDYYNGYLFIGINPKNILIVDISNPYNPLIVSEIITQDCPWDLDIQNSKLYIVTGNQLEIYDIENCNNTFLLGSCALPGFTFALKVKNNFAFISIINQNALQVVDVSDSTNPYIKSSYQAISGWGNNVQINGNYLYLCQSYYGLEVIDISEVDSLKQVGYFDTPGDLYNVYPMDDGTIFTADNHDFSVLKFDLTLSIQEIKQNFKNFYLAQNFPNPFTTYSTISYSIFNDLENINLRIYNLYGMEVKTLINAPKKRGHYSVLWDGKYENGTNASPGIYFYTLKSKTFSETKRMIKIQ